jgi:hypothetical protein
VLGGLYLVLVSLWPFRFLMAHEPATQSTKH